MKKEEYSITITIPTIGGDHPRDKFLMIRNSIENGERLEPFPFNKSRFKFYTVLGSGFRFYPSNKHWQDSVEQLGAELKKELWSIDPIRKVYEKIVNHASEELDRVHLIFEGDVSILDLPLEIICESKADHCDHFIINHPLSRKILLRKGTKRTPLKPTDIQRKLNILLVGTPCSKPESSYIENEINALYKFFKQCKHHVVKKIDPTYEQLCKELGDEDRDWDILHYAGHGAFLDSDGGGYTGIFLNPDKNSLTDGFINQTQIFKMIRDNGKSLKFVYFNCCEGAMQTGIDPKYLKPDLKGIMHGLIKAGVPSFLSYRWKVDDEVAFEFAKTFYEYVFEEGQNLRKALFSTRSDIQSKIKYANQNAWISSILVINGKE